MCGLRNRKQERRFAAFPGSSVKSLCMPERPEARFPHRNSQNGTKSHEGGFHSARARGKAGLFPELLPMPDARSFVEDAVAELVGQHQNLTAMMRLVREHVSEHGPSGGPRLRPTSARELCKDRK